MRAIRAVGNLAKPKIYDFDQDQAAKIVGAIQSELAHTEQKFAEANGPAEFSL